MQHIQYYIENNVDGEALFQLTEKDVHEIVPPIGLKKDFIPNSAGMYAVSIHIIIAE